MRQEAKTIRTGFLGKLRRRFTRPKERAAQSNHFAFPSHDALSVLDQLKSFKLISAFDVCKLRPSNEVIKSNLAVFARPPWSVRNSQHTDRK